MSREVYSNINISEIKHCLDKLEGKVTVCCDEDFNEVCISKIPLQSFSKILLCIEKEMGGE